MRLDHLLSKEQTKLETVRFHPTGRSDEEIHLSGAATEQQSSVTKSRGKLNSHEDGQQTHSVKSEAVDCLLIEFCIAFRVQVNEDSWGFSSVGRAPALQAGGQRFDPANLHTWVASSVG